MQEAGKYEAGKNTRCEKIQEVWKIREWWKWQEWEIKEMWKIQQVWKRSDLKIRRVKKKLKLRLTWSMTYAEKYSRKKTA